MRTAHNLENVVDAAVRRNVVDFTDPVLSRSVDHEIGKAKRLRPFELLVASGNEDHGRTFCLGDLRAEDRDAARSLDQDGLTLLDSAEFFERVPGGEPRARKRAGFDLIE